MCFFFFSKGTIGSDCSRLGIKVANSTGSDGGNQDSQGESHFDETTFIWIRLIIPPFILVLLILFDSHVQLTQSFNWWIIWGIMIFIRFTWKRHEQKNTESQIPFILLSFIFSYYFVQVWSYGRPEQDVKLWFCFFKTNEDKIFLKITFHKKKKKTDKY